MQVELLVEQKVQAVWGSFGGFRHPAQDAKLIIGIYGLEVHPI